MKMRALAATALTALALVAAGCGGSSSSSGSASGGGGAAGLVPRDAAVYYAAIDTDLKSSQWKQVDDLLSKLPSKDRLLASLRGNLDRQGIDFDRHVKPALGDEADVALLTAQGGRHTVVLTKPKDEAKLDALLEKGDAPHPMHEKVKGWTVISNEQAGIDAVKAVGDGDSLDDDDAFTEAFGKLPDEALAKFFVRGSATRSGWSPFGQLGTAVPGTGDLRYLTGALLAEDDGFRLDGTAKSNGDGGGTSYESKLVSQAPAGAYLFLSLHGSKESLSGLRSNPVLGRQLPQIEQALGVTLDQLGKLFQGEIALYVRQGAPIPEITLVSLVDDEGVARSTLDRLATRLGAFAGGGAPKPTTIDGVAVKQLAVGGRFSAYYAVFDGKLVVTTAPGGISGLKDGGQKLDDDSVFKSAKSAVKLPDSTSGFVYVNLKDALPVLQGLSQLGGTQLPSQVSGNLGALRSFVAYGARDGSETKFSAFLQVQ